MEEPLGKAMQAQLDRLLEFEAAVREHADPEAVHRMRVADGLGRAHDAAVRAVQVARPDGRVEIRAEGASDEDVDGAVRKRDLLERSLGMAVVVRAA